MKACRKILAIFLSLSLIDFGGISYQVYAADPPPFSSAISAKGSKEKIDARSLTQPLQPYARIGEYFQSTQKEGPTLIHIRDLHCNYEAQINISKTIESLSAELKKSGYLHEEPLLVLTEGADGQVDTSLFASFPDNEVRSQAAREFVKTGKMTGPEYLSISKPYEAPVQIVGIEEGDLYIENLKAFRDVIGQRQMTQSFINDVSERLEMFKQKAFSKELLEMDQKESGYQSGAIAFDEYARFLSARAANSIDIQNYPNFKLLVEIMDKQKKVVVDEVETERNKVMDELTDKVSKDELAKLIKRSLEFRLGKISAQEYFEELEKMMDEHLQKESYPNLVQYIELVKMQSGVDHRLLLNEVEDMTRKVRESLVKTGEEKELLEFSHQVGIVGKMFKLEMTREDLAFYKENKKLCNVESVMKQLDKFVLKYGLDLPSSLKGEANVRHYTKVFDDGDRFYEMALQRDQAMMARSMQAMEGKNIQVAVLITGGFHSDGVTELLERKDIAYVVATPKVSGEPDMTGYYNLMLDERITVAAIAFVSLFNGIAGKVSPNLQGQELDRFADLLMRLTGNKGVRNEVLTGWIDRWVDQKGGLGKLKETQPAMEQLVLRLQSQLSPEAADQQTALMTDQMIQELMNSPNLVTAELTVEVLKEMNHPQLEQAQKLLDAKRRGLYSNMDEMAQSLPRAIGEKLEQSGLENGEAQAAVRLIDLVKGLYEAMGLMKKGYHNQVHNLGVVFANLTIATSSGLAKAPRDVKVAFLAAMLHDFHVREPTLINKEGKEQGTPAFVEETMKQLRDLLGLPLTNGPPQEARYNNTVTDEMKSDFRKAINELIGKESLENLFAEAEAMIRRTDFASNVAPPPPQAGYVKAQAAESRKNMDNLVTQGKSFADIRSAVEENYEKIYQAVEADEKLNPDQKQAARTWLDRQKGIEWAYLDALSRASQDRLIQVHQLANRLEKGADQSGFYWLTTPEMVEKEVVPGLQEEIPMVNVAGSYPFFFVPELLNPEVLIILKDLPFEYKKNLIEVMRHFSKKSAEAGAKMPDSVPVKGLFQGAQADWQKREPDILAKLGLEIGSRGEILEVEAPVISIASKSSKALKEVSDPEIRLAALKSISQTIGESPVTTSAQMDLTNIDDEGQRLLLQGVLEDQTFVQGSIQKIFPEMADQNIVKMTPKIMSTAKGEHYVFGVTIEFANGEKKSLLVFAVGPASRNRGLAGVYRDISGKSDAAHRFGAETEITVNLEGVPQDYQVFSTNFHEGVPLNDVISVLEKLAGRPGTSDSGLVLRGWEKDVINALDQLAAWGLLQYVGVDKEAFLQARREKNHAELKKIQIALNNLRLKLDEGAIAAHFELYKKTGYAQNDPRRNNVIFRIEKDQPTFKLIDYEGMREVNYSKAQALNDFYAIFESEVDSVRIWSWTYMADKSGFFDAVLKGMGEAEGIPYLMEAYRELALKGNRSSWEERIVSSLSDFFSKKGLSDQLGRFLRGGVSPATDEKGLIELAKSSVEVPKSAEGLLPLAGPQVQVAEVPSGTETLGGPAETITLTTRIETYSVLLNLEYPAKLQPVTINGVEFTPKPYFQITAFGSGDEFLNQVKEKFGIKNNKEAHEKVRQLFKEASQGITFTTKRTGQYRFVEEDGYEDETEPRRTIIEIVEVDGMEAFYQNLEAALGSTLTRRPAHITLFTSGEPEGIELASQKDFEDLSRDLTPEEISNVVNAVRAERLDETALTGVDAVWSKIREEVKTEGLKGKAEDLEKLFNVLSNIYADRPQEFEKILKDAYYLNWSMAMAATDKFNYAANVAYEVLVASLIRDTVLNGSTNSELINTFEGMGFDREARERLALMVYSSTPNTIDYLIPSSDKRFAERRLYDEVEEGDSNAAAIYRFFGDSIVATEEGLRKDQEKAQQKVEEERLRLKAKLLEEVRVTPGLGGTEKALEKLINVLRDIYADNPQEFEKTLKGAYYSFSSTFSLRGNANVAYEVLVVRLIGDTVLSRSTNPELIEAFQGMGFDSKAMERLALLIYDSGLEMNYRNDGDAKSLENRRLYLDRKIKNEDEFYVERAFAIYSFFGDNLEGKITEEDLRKVQEKARQKAEEKRLLREAMKAVSAKWAKILEVVRVTPGLKEKEEDLEKLFDVLGDTYHADAQGFQKTLELANIRLLEALDISGRRNYPANVAYEILVASLIGDKVLNRSKIRQLFVALQETFQSMGFDSKAMERLALLIYDPEGIGTTYMNDGDAKSLENRRLYREVDISDERDITRAMAVYRFFGENIKEEITTEEDLREAREKDEIVPERGKEAEAPAVGRLAPHGVVNAYIGANIPQDLRDSPNNIQNYPEAEYQGVRARVIAIPGLFRNTGQLAHIGLGQVYGQPVIYVDADYAGNQTVMSHELHEIGKWEAKRKALGLEPQQMRQWILDNFEEAKKLADQWHNEAPSVEQLLAEARANNADHLAAIDQIYPEEQDINLAAGPVSILRTSQAEIEFDTNLPEESLEELRQLASEITTAYDEERFHERMGLIIGRQEGTRYTITKLIPMSKFEVGTTRDNLYPNKDEIIEFIDKKTAVDEVVLGFYHNHSFERLRSGAKPGPSGVDVIGDDLNIPGYENKIVDDRLGLVLEPELDQNKLSVKDVAEFDPAQAEVLIHGYLSPQRGRVSPGIVSLGSTPLAAILQGLSPVGATASNAVKPLEILEVALEDRIAAREQLNRRTGGTLATTETLTTEGRLDQTLEGVQAPAGETSTGAVELEDLQKQIQGQLSKLIEGGLVNPAELIAQLSRFVESNVPKSAREAALRIAGEEVGKVINKGLPDPDQGYNHQILGDKQKERMAEGIAKKLGIAKDRVMRFWQGLDREGILGPMWVNEKGGVEASGVLQRLLEKFLEISGQKEGLAGNRIRDRLYHEYTHQILKAAMNENLQGQMKGFLEDKYHQEFMKAFSDRYGTNDPEEILAKYVSYTFTGEDKDLFEKETRDPETKEETGETVADKLGDMGILANVSFPRIVIRNEEAKQVVDELLKKSPGLSNRINKENPQRSLKEIMIEFRNLTAQGVKGENLPEEFRAVEDLLRPMLRETTLASLLIGEGGTSREEQQARLKALAKQAAPRINYEGQRQADQAVKRIMIHEASPVLNRVDTLVSDGTVARVGEAEDRNIFVLDILALVKKIGEKGGKVQFEGTGVGLDQALEKLFGVRPGTRIKLMSPYSEEQTQNILKNLGVPQELIGEGKGKIEVVGNWSEQGFEGIVRNALGVEKLEGESRERAEKDVVVVLSEETQKNLAAGREDQFREEIKGMKVVVGKLGKEKGAHSIGDVLGMALVLGSVEKAFDEKGQVSPVLAEKLKTLFEPILRDILKEQGVSETEIETQVSQIIKDIAKEGFFRIPPVTDVFNDMMRELAIEEAYIEVAA